MKTGDVFVWTTTKATGHATRKKYHIYICDGDWADGVLFLFICSAHYPEDFAISQKDFPFLEKESSISCSSPVLYTDAELGKFKPQKVGSCPAYILSALCNHIAASETLEGRHIRKICEALHKALNG